MGCRWPKSIAAARAHVLGALLALDWLGTACTAAGSSSPAPAPAPPPAPVPLPAAPPVPVRPAEGRVALGTGGSLWYHVEGSGRDTIVIPLGAYLREALAPLAASHALLFYDPRNRGRSELAPDSLTATFASDVADLEVVRAALGLSKMAVIGFSYFGAVAAAYAAAHPDRVTRLVLLSPIEPSDTLASAYAPQERRARIDTTAARALLKMRAAGLDTAASPAYCEAYWRVNAPVFVGDTTHAARLRPAWCELPNEHPRAMGVQLAREMRSLGDRYDLSAMATRVRVPALVVHGGRDLVASPEGARAWVRLMPQAQDVTLPRAGHFAFLDDSQGVLDAIRGFLSRN